MASVICLAESSKERFTLAQELEFRMPDECLSIFIITGTVKKVQRYKSLENLKIEPIDPVSDQYISLVNMAFLWRLPTPTAEDHEKGDGLVFV